MPDFVVNAETNRTVAIRQSTIDKFVDVVNGSPGLTIKDYSKLTGIGRQTLKTIVRFAPEGAVMRSKGQIAHAIKGRKAAWEKIPGTKVASPPSNAVALTVQPPMGRQITNVKISDDANAFFREILALADTSYLGPVSLKKKVDSLVQRFFMNAEQRDKAEQANIEHEKERAKLEQSVTKLLATRQDLIAQNRALEQRVAEEDALFSGIAALNTPTSLAPATV